MRRALHLDSNCGRSVVLKPIRLANRRRNVMTPFPDTRMRRAYACRMVVVSVFAGGAGLQVEEVALAKSTDYVIAVDHGYLLAQAVGCGVDELIGDMDSLAPFKVSEANASGVVVVECPSEKDSSDLELALRRAIAVPNVSKVMVFGIGTSPVRPRRPDHGAINLAVLANPELAAVPIEIYFDGAQVRVVHNNFSIYARVGATVSLLAVGGVATGVTTDGLRWALDDATLTPFQAWGLSNEITSSPASVSLTSGVILVFVVSADSG